MPTLYQDIALVTCSYGPDAQRCQRMCESVDRWVDHRIHHHLVVPARDLPTFRRLASGRRSVVAVEDVVPAAFWQAPLTQRWWLDEQGWPVRGWIMQQVTKLSANFATDAEHIVFVDSDLQFIKPFTADTILEEGRLRLHRIAGAKQQGEHLLWHHRAADLLGVERRYFGADFVGQLISWRRSHLTGLQNHIEEIHQKPWHRCVARSVRVSEYILYGAYIESIVGLWNSGHFGSADDICHCCWFLDEAQDLLTGLATPRDNAVAVLLQSNLGLSHDEEQHILQNVTSIAPHSLEAYS